MEPKVESVRQEVADIQPEIAIVRENVSALEPKIADVKGEVPRSGRRPPAATLRVHSIGRRGISTT